jgi:Glycoside hydrolase family 44
MLIVPPATASKRGSTSTPSPGRFRAFGAVTRALPCTFLLLVAATLRLAAQTDQPIFTDSLQNGWQNWGWATLNYNNTSPVHSGSASVAVTITSGNQGIYIAHAAFDSSPYASLSFWLNGGASGGQQLLVQGHAGNAAQTTTNLPPLAANTWQEFNISLATLGCDNRADMDGFWIQDRSGAAQPTFYVDDITLVASTAPPVTNAPAPVAISVDAQLNRHAISPLIYGVAFATTSQLADLNSPLNRSGGNAETRYNWQLNAHNHAADWYYESIDDGSATPAATADAFIASSQSGGAQPLLTIPMIGWVPKLGPGRGKLASYSIAKYGPQTGNDWQWMADAGNGISSTNANKPITWNNATDANFATNSAFQQAFVQHLTNRWGLSTNSGVRYYLMDNEHTLWHSTHQDIHPVGTTMQEIRSNLFDYAGMVKALDPNALVLAPEEWGWAGYLYSGYDQQWSGQHGDYNPAHYPDRAANGGWDYMPWLLDQFRQHDTNTGHRLLDYFTLHCYPQENGVSGSGASSATALLRNQSTRQFWDTNYVDPSWINSIIMLIPRMKNWASTYYPGTKIGITEYNWGAEANINGATAQADIFGIFGREGLDLATRWTTPDATTPTYKAMKLFRNYDGNKSGFGDVSVSATAPNPDNVSSFAALRSMDGALTLMVINKQLNVSAAATCSLTNFLPAGTAQVWQLTSANAITRLGDIAFTGNTFSNPVPAQSITLFVLLAGAPPHLRAGVLNAGNAFDFWLDGQAGQRYVIQASTNFVYWTAVQTNTLGSNSFHVVLAATSIPYRFYRAQWAP